jgi:hypothetical protein
LRHQLAHPAAAAAAAAAAVEHMASKGLYCVPQAAAGICGWQVLVLRSCHRLGVANGRCLCCQRHQQGPPVCPLCSPCRLLPLSLSLSHSPTFFCSALSKVRSCSSHRGTTDRGTAAGRCVGHRQQQQQVSRGSAVWGACTQAGAANNLSVCPQENVCSCCCCCCCLQSRLGPPHAPGGQAPPSIEFTWEPLPST